MKEMILLLLVTWTVVPMLSKYLLVELKDTNDDNRKNQDMKLKWIRKKIN